MSQAQPTRYGARNEESVERVQAIALGAQEENGSPEKLYLDLMKKCLTRIAFPERYAPIKPPRTIPRKLAWNLCQKLLLPLELEIVRRKEFDSRAREGGLDWPGEAETMVGIKRLDNLEVCITDVLRQRVPGDLIETGVWRGGASIFMRAVLKAYGDTQRTVWLADSFHGLPKPNPAKYPADVGDESWKNAALAIPVEEVKANFCKYGLLDEQVRFLVGWFRDTLPTAPIDKLAVLRLDGDMYESTFDALTHLYPKLSHGGYAIIDDYAFSGCQSAVEDYRVKHQIKEPLLPIDQYAKFWQRLT
jgi:O-methyltransferase